MPIHRWTKEYSWLFHHFHGEWIRTIGRALNDGLLPPDYYALSEQVTDAGTGGLLLAEPKTRIVETLGVTPSKKNQVAVKHSSDDQTVAVIEIVSPGNKDSRHSFRSFLDKTVDLLAKGIHLLVIDLHAPTKRDSNGIHAAIQDELSGKEFVPPGDKPLTLAAYEAVSPPKGYIEPVAVGDILPDMPLFLVPGGHVMVPLERTYAAAWEGVPARWRKVLDAQTP